MGWIEGEQETTVVGAQPARGWCEPTDSGGGGGGCREEGWQPTTRCCCRLLLAWLLVVLQLLWHVVWEGWTLLLAE